MPDSHVFSLETSPAMSALRQFLEERWSLPADDAAKSQPEFERGLRERMRALELDVHEADLTRQDVSVPGIVVDGVRYRRREGTTPGEYMTMAGMAKVERTVYEIRGGHGGKTLIPLEMRLGLLGGWTPAAASVAASYMASMPSKEAAKLLARSGNMTPSASHLDRLPKLFNAEWEGKRVELETAVREEDELPDPQEVAVIQYTGDGVMVPMKEAPRQKDGEDGPHGHKEASSATISLFDRQGERLHTIRFGRMPESKKVVLQQQMTAELRRVVTLFPGVPVEACADGAEENWRIIKEVAAALGIEVTPVLDYYHANEHVSEALTLYAGKDKEQAKHDRLYWGKVLAEEPKGVDRVIKALQYRAAKSRGKTRDEIEKALNYVEGHREMMDYHGLRAKHWPIGSGIQEAACKTLVSTRYKQSGMTWREPGGQGILTLRGLDQSGRWDAAWSVLRQHLLNSRIYNIDQETARQRPRPPAAARSAKAA